jgi:hypothetical protein
MAKDGNDARKAQESSKDVQLDDSFGQHLSQASNIVQRWPTWKQAILGRTVSQSSDSLQRSASSPWSNSPHQRQN